jgi:hypothetical protein
MLGAVAEASGVKAGGDEPPLQPTDSLIGCWLEERFYDLGETGPVGTLGVDGVELPP